jgi:hypothetical protein
MKSKFALVGLLMLGACTTVSPTKSVLIGCNQAYGTLGMLKAMSRAGKVTVTQDQRILIDQTFTNIVNPICFADTIKETPENADILKGVIEALESYQIGEKA